MSLTNNHALPEMLVRAVSFDGYDALGDISVTGLLKPPQIAFLEGLYGDAAQEDVADRLWALLGSAAHEVMYRSRGEGMTAERRLTMTVGGWEVSGKSDLYEAGMITDWKVTSAWTVVFEPKGRKEWHEQLNLYRLLLEANGFEVERLQICAILRDWSESQLKRDTRGNYPKVPFVLIDIPLWERAFARSFLERRVKAHQDAREGNYEQCSDEDRWLNDKGEYVRCERYCKVADFCSQWRHTTRKAGAAPVK